MDFYKRVFLHVIPVCIIVPWAKGPRFVLVMKNRAHHEGLKCSPYEAVFGKPLKEGLKTSNLPDKAIKDIQTEEELQEIISAVHDLTETTMQEQQNNKVEYIP